MDKKFSHETRLVNQLREHLLSNKFTIAQLVSPGGQCHLSISFTDSKTGKKRTAFPDLVCFSDKEIIIGEVKPKFSKADKSKLLSLKSSADADLNIRKTLSRKYSELENLPLIYLLIHGDPMQPADDTFTQMFLVAGSVLFQAPTPID